MKINVVPQTTYYSKYIKTNSRILHSIMSKSDKIHCEKSKKRIKEILITIIKKDKEGLKKICNEGLPDDLPILRSLIWKINLNFLNFDVDKWDEHILKKRAEYEDIKFAFMLKLEAERKLFLEFNEYNEFNKKASPDTELNDKSIKKEKELGNYLKYTDKNLLEEIDKDVRRTHTDLNFFFMPSKPEDLEKLTNEQIRETVDKRRSNDVKTIDDIYLNRELNKFETHGDVISRILYIYAKLNPDLNYVQGMNELIAPIYFIYSFDSTSNDDNISDHESDTFWSFTYLMDDLKVLFMRSKDDSREGIFKKMELLKMMIEVVDKEVFDHFNKNSVELSHFAFKWFILFFTQDFILPDVLRLWDTIFCEKNRFYFLFYISLAIVKILKNKFIKMDFAGIIISLQNLEDLEIDKILIEVFKLRKEYDKKIKKIIEQNK